MDRINFNKKIKLVDKYLKKKKLYNILTVKLNNFNNTDIYLGLVFHKRSRAFKIFWINLTKVENRYIEDWMNLNLIYPSEADKIKEIIATNGISPNYIDKDDIDSEVTIESFITNYNNNKKVFVFKRYIPECWRFLDNAMAIISNNMPKTMYFVYQILVEKLITPEPNYLFAFDLSKDNIDKLYDKEEIDKGKILKDKVVNLESVKNSYYGVVKDKEEYLTTIVYDNDNKELQLSCTCGNNQFCRHTYAALLNIKNKELIRFKKIAYKNDNIDYFERLKNFEFILCYKIIDDYFLIVQNDELVLLPILDEKNTCPWEIVEDDSNKTLEKQLKKYLKSKNII